MLRVVAAALSAAAAAAESNRTASRLGRLQDIDDWLSNASGGPPRHWRVRSPADVSGNSTALVESYQKEVNISRLAGSAAPVVVKALQNAGAFAFGHRESDIAYFELLYLEWLRGEPGIPWLWGGWTTPSRVVWVVSHGGDRVGTGKALSTHRAHFSPAYERRARERPLDLARAWLRCFRSFAEWGGFVLTDFKPEQFTLDAKGDIYLVDGPAPNSGPVAAFARRRFRSGGDAIYVPGDARPKHVDLEPGAAWPCAWKCRKRTYAHHHCAGENYCENHDPGAPEITACRGGACARFDGRVHVHDAAARGWVLPHIIALAEDRAVARRLETLRAIMTREDPRDRPTFDGILRFLGRP